METLGKTFLTFSNGPRFLLTCLTSFSMYSQKDTEKSKLTPKYLLDADYSTAL